MSVLAVPAHWGALREQAMLSSFMLLCLGLSFAAAQTCQGVFGPASVSLLPYNCHGEYMSGKQEAASCLFLDLGRAAYSTLGLQASLNTLVHFDCKQTCCCQGASACRLLVDGYASGYLLEGGGYKEVRTGSGAYPVVSTGVPLA